MPKVDLSELERRTESIYPGEFDAWIDGRSSLRLGDAGSTDAFWKTAPTQPLPF